MISTYITEDTIMQDIVTVPFGDIIGHAIHQFEENEDQIEITLRAVNGNHYKIGITCEKIDKEEATKGKPH